jgi:hypothetical protein
MSSYTVEHSHKSIFSERPILTGVLVGLASLAPHFFLPHDLSVQFAALLVALIAGIYFGFAVVNGATREQLIEFNVAGLFLLAALIGIALWPGVIVIAYFAHALWDTAHHNRLRLSLVAIPTWYVPWCVVIDIIIGAGLIAIWRTNGVL